MLQHFSPIDNHYLIVKDGFLKSSSKTNNIALFGKPSKWIYTRLDTDINKYDHHYHFLLDENLLLHTKFILNTSWLSEDNKPNYIIDGTTLTKQKLHKILDKFKQIAKLTFEFNHLLKKTDLKMSQHSNEILIQDDIDLHKYLIKYNGGDQDTIEYLNTHYKNVIIE
jgi:hypothetical protein